MKVSQMKNRIWLGVAVASLLSGMAFAQALPGLFIASPTGSEAINVVNTGPQIASIFLKQARDATGYQKAVPLTAFTLSFGNAQSMLSINPAGTLATGTINLAALPVDGQMACIFSTATQTALTLQVPSGSTATLNNAITAMTANTRYCYQYSASNTSWDRVQ